MSTQKYWQDKAATMDAEISADIEAAKNPTRDDLLRRLQAMEGANAENGQMFTAEQIAIMKNRIAKIDHDQKADFLAEWTLETTQARRAAWNLRVNGGEFTRAGKIWYPALRDAEKAQGWTMDDIKEAVKLHNL